MVDNFDKKKIIAALRAQGIPDKDIEKLYGKLPPMQQAKPTAANAWKYKNKHSPRTIQQEDIDPDYEPIEELQKKGVKKPRISKKKPKIKVKKPKNDWNTSSETRLKALYEAGYSTEEMANEFKTTKDAITGKLSRLKAAGWKATIGTTHSPIPSPSTSPQTVNRKLNPAMKKFLANALETNFGVVGRFFSKKWGLIDDKKFLGKGGGNADLTAAVIKANQEVIASLTKLDASLRRGTSTLTRSVAAATTKMVDAINEVVELVRKNAATETTSGGGSGGGRGGAGGVGGVGVLAALLGGAGLAMLLGSRADASVNPTEQLSNDEITTPQDTEQELRDKGAQKPPEQTPELDFKTKELSFEADDITFEADEFKFNQKGKTASPSGDGATSESKPSAGFFNDLADKMIGGRGGGYAGGGGPKSPIPSDQELDQKDKAWFGSGSKPGTSPTGAAAGGGGKDGNKIQQAMSAAKAQLRAEGVPEANLDAAASHLVGQAMSESGLNPNTSHDSGTGYGVYGARLDRRNKMLSWMKQNNFESNSLEGQMKYMAHEAMSDSYKPSRDALMGANKDNFEDVSRTLTHNFEGPKIENWQDRMGNARKAFNTPAAAIKITPDAWKDKTAPISPWMDKDHQDIDGTSIGEGRRGLETDYQNKFGVPPPEHTQMGPSVDSGAQLNGAQKEQDDQTNSPNFDERFNAAYPNKRSDNSTGEDNSFQTTILETQGPSHFADYEGLRGTGGDSWQTMDG